MLYQSTDIWVYWVVSTVVIMAAQVPMEACVDGYKCFYACSEWYQFSTPFHQWYSKNMASIALPWQQQLGLSPGHVLWLD